MPSQDSLESAAKALLARDVAGQAFHVETRALAQDVGRGRGYVKEHRDATRAMNDPRVGHAK